MIIKHIVVVMSWADANLADAWRASAAALGAECAFVQGATPALTDALRFHLGADEIVLVPVTADAALGKSWVTRIARWWLAESGWPGRMHIAPVTRGSISCLPQPDTLTELHSGGAGLQNPAWQEPPPVSLHVIVCQGPRCHAQGAAATLRELNKSLKTEGMSDTSVLVTQAGCLYPCNRAPVICVQPNMEWKGPIHAEDVPDFVAQLKHYLGM
ncbi:(2Fe-2S) ferredoxin domain-containing protein [Corynebacterium hindlerae]|uniref:(2Fe-2S) ferredoxin domain-containing protein n=1 Tax=Corynebacterium hindlerae TaxID=699041 RepID=UPI0031B6C67B